MRKTEAEEHCNNKHIKDLGSKNPPKNVIRSTKESIELLVIW
jgi:hypothetical protein